MSNWNHAICEVCWLDREGEWKDIGNIDHTVMALVSVRRPVRLTEPDLTECCFCSSPTISGIFVRQDPATLECAHVESDRTKD